VVGLRSRLPGGLRGVRSSSYRWWDNFGGLLLFLHAGFAFLAFYGSPSGVPAFVEDYVPSGGLFHCDVGFPAWEPKCSKSLSPTYTLIKEKTRVEGQRQDSLLSEDKL